MKKIPLVQGGQGRTGLELTNNPILRITGMGLFKLITVALVLAAILVAVNTVHQHRQQKALSTHAAP